MFLFANDSQTIFRQWLHFLKLGRHLKGKLGAYLSNLFIIGHGLSELGVASLACGALEAMGKFFLSSALFFIIVLITCLANCLSYLCNYSVSWILKLSLELVNYLISRACKQSIRGLILSMGRLNLSLFERLPQLIFSLMINKEESVKDYFIKIYVI